MMHVYYFILHICCIHFGLAYCICFVKLVVACKFIKSEMFPKIWLIFRHVHNLCRQNMLLTI